MATVDESRFVFNLVWTADVFHVLRFFAASQMAQSGARFRFLANGCTGESLAAMEAFADRHPDRVVEVMVVREEMGAHGIALDEVFAARDDGEFFSFIDTDIKARGPFLPEFASMLESCDAVSSGRGVWCDSDVVPDGHPGVAGEHFFDSKGFAFGSPHFSIYRREALGETFDKWGVQFRNAGPDAPQHARDRMVADGHDYKIYDTGKVVNILFQAEHVLRHYEHPNLMHIGGVSHYIEPGAYITRDGEKLPDWVRYASMASRFEVAKFTAEILQASIDGRPVPSIPPGLDVELEAKIATVRDEMVDMVERYREW